MGLLHLRLLTDDTTKSIYDITASIDRCITWAITGLFSSSNCSKTALPFDENNKLDIVKEKNRRQLLDEQWTVLFRIPSFKLLVTTHNEINWYD